MKYSCWFVLLPLLLPGVAWSGPSVAYYAHGSPLTAPYKDATRESQGKHYAGGKPGAPPNNRKGASAHAGGYGRLRTTRK